MAEPVKKQYGLILKKNKPALFERAIQSTAASAFADSDDDDNNEAQVGSSERPSASTLRVRAQTQRLYERALAENPSVFEYDSIYDELQMKKNEKISEQKTADDQRKSKYAEKIIKAHKRRVLENELREDRKQQKEREAEAGKFDDRETFVTGAYRKQMEELEKLRLQEAMENRLDELTAVEKQKGGMWQGGFYRTLLSDLAREVEPVKKEETEMDVKDEHVDGSARMIKMLRDGQSSFENDVFGSDFNKPEKAKVSSKKSACSSDSDEERSPSEPRLDALRPGINILSRPKKPTKAEQLSSRFTPTRSDSDDSDKERIERRDVPHSSRQATRHDEKRGDRRHHKTEERNRRRHGSGDSVGRDSSRKERSRRRSQDERDKERDRDRVRSRKDEKKEKDDSRRERRHSKKEEKNGKEKMADEIESDKMKTEPSKEERLKTVKKLLAHRNDEKQIEEYRQRYFQRKADHTLVIPM
ncbi:hypothetical protein AB6A40_006128 [Gnathostoma spinigerum]|uniref:Nuclear speckle splicing regulatory protein 1 N-terminal domain-containing protein n=1 Tax=Gnathostoma spinigerum TaxID=75299 RepID=A0ABD6EMP2_9BILA